MRAAGGTREQGSRRLIGPWHAPGLCCRTVLLASQCAAPQACAVALAARPRRVVARRPAARFRRAPAAAIHPSRKPRASAPPTARALVPTRCSGLRSIPPTTREQRQLVALHAGAVGLLLPQCWQPWWCTCCRCAFRCRFSASLSLHAQATADWHCPPGPPPSLACAVADMFTRPAPWLAESILHLGCHLEMNTTPIVHGQSRAASREWQWGVHMPLAFYLSSLYSLYRPPFMSPSERFRIIDTV